MVDRDAEVYLAKLAEQAGRYDDMTFHMEAVVRHPNELSADERNLLSAAYKNAVGRRRVAWRIIRSLEQQERTKGNEQQAKYADEYCQKLEDELHVICETVLGLFDGNDNIIDETDAETKVFYHKTRADYHRYLAEFRRGGAKAQAAAGAQRAYGEALEVAEIDLAVTHPTRLGLALNYSVFLYEVLEDSGKAIEIARAAFEGAIAELDSVVVDSYQDTTSIMQLLRDNLTLWTAEPGAGEGAQ
eukprot:CAMPEP_0168374058 /NCGR_PEP_ID=MMETSP0228-20121227/9108_1 /TAXON_ID=133427 /ORGANISM="Protoceratium reticulatum, Strain CCCM 535 (=CCMP 1889)" /LENGTH=243 /DNA_ID=CAMNT_0008386999 /DNA_START=70 /DNA_END=801 /DNA_ORIENTATION=+